MNLVNSGYYFPRTQEAPSYGGYPGQYCYNESCRKCSDPICENSQAPTFEETPYVDPNFGTLAFQNPQQEHATLTARHEVLHDEPYPTRSTPGGMGYREADPTAEPYGATETTYDSFFGSSTDDPKLERKQEFEPVYLRGETIWSNASPKEFARPRNNEIYPESSTFAEGAYFDRGIEVRQLGLNRYTRVLEKSDPGGCFLEPATGGRGTASGGIDVSGFHEQYRHKPSYADRVGAPKSTSNSESIRSFFQQAKSRRPSAVAEWGAINASTHGMYGGIDVNIVQGNKERGHLNFEEWGRINGGGPGAYSGIDTNKVRGQRERGHLNFEEWGRINGGGPGAYGGIDTNKVRGQRERGHLNFEEWGGLNGGGPGAFGSIDVNHIRGNRERIGERVQTHVTLGGFSDGTHMGEFSEGFTTRQKPTDVIPGSSQIKFGRGGGRQIRERIHELKSTSCETPWDDSPRPIEQMAARSVCFADQALNRSSEALGSLMVVDPANSCYYDEVCGPYNESVTSPKW